MPIHCDACGNEYYKPYHPLCGDSSIFPTSPGVYEIFHRGTYYVGEANNLRVRLRAHANGLLNGTHAQPDLLDFSDRCGGGHVLRVRIIWRGTSRTTKKKLELMETLHIQHRRSQHRGKVNVILDTARRVKAVPKHRRSAAAHRAVATKRAIPGYLEDIHRRAARTRANNRKQRKRRGFIK